MGKKNKVSGLSGADLVLSIDTLEKLQRSLTYEKPGIQALGATNETEDSGEGLAAVLALMKAKMGKNKPLSLSATIDCDLEKLNITPDGIAGLVLKPGHAERAATTRVLGQEKLWSSPNLYRQLELLEILVPSASEASARAWIDAFFFRASAMVPSDKRMVLSLEQVVPQTTMPPSSSTTLSGLINYTAIIANENPANFFLSDPTLAKLRATMPSGFFVAQAKARSLNLTGHLPQAISEMYACAKYLKKDILRGALTDGHTWIFIIIVLKPNGNGAKYRQSLPINFVSNVEHAQIVKPWPDVVAGILLHWIKNSFADIGSDDWFEDSKDI